MGDEMKIGWSDHVPYWGKDYVPRSVLEKQELERCLREMGKELEATRALVRELYGSLLEAKRDDDG